MKKQYLFLIAFFFCFNITHGQLTFTANTYFVTLPTAGCNGVWAVEWQNCGTPPFLINPAGCLTFGAISGDTMFFNLCSIPCEFEAANDSGNICMMCTIGFLNGTQEIKLIHSEVNVYPNPANEYIRINGTIPSNALFSMTDIQGKIILEENLNSTQQENYISIKGKKSGFYFWKIQTGTELYEKGEIQIIN
ncbi:MAG TPA: T9SS type A sorting domain-containing protein [Bacteroidia bacterium]|nr:T9SS type A sorting domain-containing protein [Bacteroidia bacterium]